MESVWERAFLDISVMSDCHAVVCMCLQERVQKNSLSSALAVIRSGANCINPLVHERDMSILLFLCGSHCPLMASLPLSRRPYDAVHHFMFEFLFRPYAELDFHRRDGFAELVVVLDAQLCYLQFYVIHV